MNNILYAQYWALSLILSLKPNIELDFRLSVLLIYLVMAILNEGVKSRNDTFIESDFLQNHQSILCACDSDKPRKEAGRRVPSKTIFLELLE